MKGVVPAAAMATLVAFGSARAQVAAQPTNTMDAGAAASAVNNGYGNWSSLYLRGTLQASPSTVIYPEIVASREFHDQGALFSLGATHVLDNAWYVTGAATTSAGGFYLPRARVVAVANRKVLPSKRLVLNAGGSYAQWKDVHSDIGFSAGGAYYFTSPLLLEAGTNRNVSRPGNVASQSYFGAVTAGSAGTRYLTFRATGGHEAYSPLAPGQAIADFASHNISLSLRQWVRRGRGFVVGVEQYGNPFYHRESLSLGAFWPIE